MKNMKKDDFLLVRLIAMLLFMVVISSAFGQEQRLQWGDQDNGTYINPILCADYSDPDVIRVGEKYL